MSRVLFVFVSALAVLVAVVGSSGGASADPANRNGTVQAAPEGAEAAGRGDWETRVEVVRDARKWLGTPYQYSTCTKVKMSCDCLVRRAWSPNGPDVGLNENKQWRYEPSRKIRNKENLKPGDIVFFKEGGADRFTHVAIYAYSDGNRRYIVHASKHYGQVVEGPMRVVSGFHGALRLNPR